MSVLRLFLSDERQRSFEKAAASEGLTPRLMHALLDLSPGEPKPMGWLAEQWFCDASNVTGLIDGLETRGLARREVSPDDRRVKLITLTDHGVAVRERVKETLMQPPDGLAEMSASDLRALRDLMAKAAARYPWPR